jgi:putative Holliday junction resolvase
MAGETGFQAGRALQEIRRLKHAFPETEFVEWDERLTTRLASPPKPVTGERRRTKKSVNRSTNKKRGGKERVDHLAAARILQEYLDRSG